MGRQFGVLIMFLLAGMALGRSHMPDLLFDRENEIENNGVTKIVAHAPLDFLGELSCQVEQKEVKYVKGKCVKEGCDTGLYFYPFHQDCMFKR